MDKKIKVIWIDQNVDNVENTHYFNILNELQNYEIMRIKTVEQSIQIFKDILFAETIIVVSGKFFTLLIDELKKNLTNINFIPNIIIFTGHYNEFIHSVNESHKQYLNHNFYNPGGITTNFEDVLKYILNPYAANIKNSFMQRDDGQISFDNIDSKEKLILPLLFKRLIDYNKVDNGTFIKMLYEKYYDKSKNIKAILDGIKSLEEIPLEKLFEYYIKIYTDEESQFYKDINMDLKLNKRFIYLTYIKILYEGVNLKVPPLVPNCTLYRGTFLFLKEIEYMEKLEEIKCKEKYKDKAKKKGLPGNIIFSKSFLSFSKQIKIALNFASNPNKNSRKVLFILEIENNKDDNINYILSTYADIKKFSLFKNEEEVLFFPYSSFEFLFIRKSNKYEGILEIGLKYLGIYYKFLDDKNIKNQIVFPKTKFSEEIFESGLIKRGNIIQNNINDIENSLIINPLFNMVLNQEKKKKTIEENEQINSESIFEYMDIKGKMILSKYKNLVHNGNIAKEDFIEMLYERYYKKSKFTTDFLDSIREIKDIPIEILSKYYIRIYLDDDSRFYHDINTDLLKNKIDIYLSYIQVLYEGVKLKSLPLLDKNIVLYRSTFLSQKVIENMINLRKENQYFPCIIFSKTFLSFTKEWKIVSSFLKRNSPAQDFCKVLLILEMDNIQDDNKKYFNNSYADVEKISFYPGEKEVLLFPFSSFEILSIVKKENFTEIRLRYLGKDFDNSQEKQMPESTFKKINLINQNNLNYPVNNAIIPNYNAKNSKKKNFIIGHFYISENDINKKIRIINSFDQAKIKYNFIQIDDELNFKNEKEILDYCEISINGIKMPKFDFFLVFSKSGYYSIQYSFKKNITKTDFMFAECINLVFLDTFNFDFKYVYNMVGMFLDCFNLKNIKFLNSDDKPRIIDMRCIFRGCKSLEYLDLSFFNTQNVNNMSHLFFECKSLKSLNLSSFNTKNVVYMLGMFSGCESLINLELLNFDTQNVVVMSKMFLGCKSLKSLDLSNFITNKVEYMNSMFYGCCSLSFLNIANFTVDKVISMSDIFTGCISLKMNNLICKNKVQLYQRLKTK